MEEKQDINPIPPAIPSTLSQTPTPTSETPRIKSKLPIIIAAVMLILVIAGASAYLFMFKPKPKTQEPIAKMQQPTPTPDPTANWKTYTNEYFAFKYPANWVTAKDPEYNGGGTIVYNPLKMKKINEGGPELIEVPEEYLDFISAEISNTTAKQDIDNEAQKWKGIDLNRQSIEKKGIDYELFNSIGGGDAPKDRTVEISNGYVLVKVLSSIMKLDDGRIESQILSTFKFTPPAGSQAIDTSNWKTYVGKDYSFNYPNNWLTDNSQVYDPSTSYKGGNGGNATLYRTQLWFKEVVSSQTVDQYIGQYYGNEVGSKSTSVAITNNLSGKSFYNPTGEGYVGWYLAFSNGSNILLFGPAPQNIMQESTDITIINSLKFTK